LSQAEDSIDCALYDVDLVEIIDILAEKSIVMNVRLIVDDDNWEMAERFAFARNDSRSALMHNKFCIVDERFVFTGSFNPTENGAYKNDNNMLVIESRILAGNYLDEFEEMWDGTFGKGEGVGVASFYLNGAHVENYFCPEDRCSERVREHILAANQSIYFTAFSFTDNRIANALLVRFHEGLDVRGVFEKTRISRYSVWELLDFQGVDVVYDTNPYVMHHKFFLIDNRTVITGSFNPSKNADKRNDENIIIIDDASIAEEFLEEFSIIIHKT
jgi:phosphatidylserine/phosphatidylglycerophosphate/cardiolipin synthase-like enzyme